MISIRDMYVSVPNPEGVNESRGRENGVRASLRNEGDINIIGGGGNDSELAGGRVYSLLILV